MVHEEIRDNIKYAYLPTAQEFVSALAPWSQWLESPSINSWIFRGQAKKEWPLLPSAFRSQSSLNKFMPSSCKTNHDQIRLESKTLLTFFEIADVCGITLPEDSQRLRARIEKIQRDIGVGTYFEELKKGNVQWPAEELLSVTGLAQHYGLPTRLLDWSYNSYIAAYFAASGVVKDAYESSHTQKKIIEEYCRIKGIDYDDTAARISIGGHDKTLAVWAYSLSIDIAVRHSLSKNPPYLIIKVPYATNPNISAQKGLFTMVLNPFSDEKGEVERIPFDRAVVNHFGTHKYPPDKSPFLTCFYTNHDQAFEILRLIASLGVSASSVFPGFSGISETVSEKLWWWLKQD